MKKAYKIVSILTIVLMLACVCTNVFAALTIVLMLACVCTNVFAAINMDNIKAGDTKSDSQMEKIGSVIISYITNAAMVIAVVMLAALGIKYMIGSAEEKAEYKKSLLPLVIGAVLVFGAAAIAKVIVALAQNFKA